MPLQNREGRPYADNINVCHFERPPSERREDNLNGKEEPQAHSFVRFPSQDTRTPPTRKGEDRPLPLGGAGALHFQCR